jgi:hypothetical protein
LCLFLCASQWKRLRQRSMDDFTLITNRKRAAIALAHSVVFLLIALRSLATASSAEPVWMRMGIAFSGLILCMYLAVTSVLLYLVKIARCVAERIYFGFCASSAALGLMRTALGDPRQGALYLRVVMLVCAVATGIIILRGHSRPALVADSYETGASLPGDS